MSPIELQNVANQLLARVTGLEKEIAELSAQVTVLAPLKELLLPVQPVAKRR